MTDDREFHSLVSYLASVPGVEVLGRGHDESIGWWVKFSIDIEHPLAWHVVQELGHVLNYISIDERLPTVFKPVSPPSYLNGGPKEYLSWVIECSDQNFKPDTAAEWLEGRLPRPVSDVAQWNTDN